ncbi:MAG: hypothetical protein GX801_04830 [Fibrobacter sp.]|nr:hypothetical protein [Fibrobacter sp.]
MRKLLLVLGVVLLWACADKPTGTSDSENNAVKVQLPLSLDDISPTTLYKWQIPSDSGTFANQQVLGEFIDRFVLDSNQFELHAAVPLEFSLADTKVTDTIYINYGDKKLVDYIPYPDLSLDTAAVRDFFDTLYLNTCSEIKMIDIPGYSLQAEGLVEGLELFNMKEQPYHYKAKTILGPRYVERDSIKINVVDSTGNVDSLSPRYFQNLELAGCNVSTLFITWHQFISTHTVYNVPASLWKYENHVLAWSAFVIPKEPVGWKLHLTDQFGKLTTLELTTVFLAPTITNHREHKGQVLQLDSLTTDEIDSFTVYHWLAPGKKGEIDTIAIFGHDFWGATVNADTFHLSVKTSELRVPSNLPETVDTVYINYGPHKIVDFMPYPYGLELDTANALKLFDTISIDPCGQVNLPILEGHKIVDFADLPEGLTIDSKLSDGLFCDDHDSVAGFYHDSLPTSIYSDWPGFDDKMEWRLAPQSESASQCAVYQAVTPMCDKGTSYIWFPQKLQQSRHRLRAWADFVAPAEPVSWQMIVEDQYGRSTTLDITTVFKTAE